MRKTKSQFLKERGAFWTEHFAEEGFPPGAVKVDELARRDVAAAEAAGVTWDPEPAKWPDKVEVEMTAWSCSLKTTAEPGPIGIRTVRPLSPEETTEAARRWNAWPEIERALAQLEDWPGEAPSITDILRTLTQAVRPGGPDARG